MSYHSEAELAQQIRASLPKDDPSNPILLPADAGFILLTSVVGARSSTVPMLVVPQHITAMTPTSDGTTLYMTGGKHITVKESCDAVMDIIVSFHRYNQFGKRKAASA